ncbi:MAG: hypothetical protein ACR2PG_27520 [Hyphomicrobiaceae bacterium]
MIASFFVIEAGPGGWNDNSRLATVQALVEQGTFKIDRTYFFYWTHDKVLVNGNYYSDKPPLPSLLAAVVYYPLYIAGFRLTPSDSLAHVIIVALTVKLSLLAGLICFYQSLRHSSLTAEKRLILTAALAVSTLILPWSTVLNNHILSAAFLMIAFYFYLESRANPSRLSNLIFSGTFFGLSGLSDVPTSIFIALFATLIFINRRSLKDTMFFLCAPLVLYIIYLTFNFSVSNSIWPPQINENFFDYPGSPWISNHASPSPESSSGIETKSIKSSVDTGVRYLVGQNGFVLYNPILLIAAPCLIWTILAKHPLWREASAISTGTAIIILYYSITTTNAGGGSYSIRWFVPLLPLLVFFLFGYLQELTKHRLRVLSAVMLISFAIACIGAVQPWTKKHIFGSTSIVANMKVLGEQFD